MIETDLDIQYERQIMLKKEVEDNPTLRIDSDFMKKNYSAVAAITGSEATLRASLFVRR